MNKITHHKQQGVASLLTAIILLISITLVALFTSKTVLMETKIDADNYRNTQAVAAAQAGMDRALAYFGDGDIDHDSNGTADFTTPSTAQMPSATNCPTTDTELTALGSPAFAQRLSSGTQATISMFYFVNTTTYDHDNNSATAAINNPCDNTDGTAFTAGKTDRALIIAKGWSDDCTAVRTVRQCVGSFSTLNNIDTPAGAGVPAPVVSVSSVLLHGNGTMINRFSQSNVWTGDPSYTITGESLQTFLRKSGTSVSDFSLKQLLAPVPASAALTDVVEGRALADYTQVGSTNKSGNGVDIITGDKTLAQVKFTNFFSKSIFDIATLAQAEGKCYSSSTTITITDDSSPAVTRTLPCTGGASVPNQATGTVFADASASLPTQVGVHDATDPTQDKAAILIINGDRNLSGTFYGFVYATGTLNVNGNTDIVGSILSRNQATGNGAINVTYRPLGGSAVDNTGANVGYDLSEFIKKGVISGSWQDW